MTSFTAGTGSPLMKQTRKPWGDLSPLVFSSLQTTGCHCDGLKRSPTAAHNVWLHRSNISIHEEVSSMTFGSVFHLQHVQRLQNSHGGTLGAVSQGSCYQHDESCRFCAASTVSLPQEHHSLLQEAVQLLDLGPFEGIWMLWTRRGVPLGLHLQKFALCNVTTPLTRCFMHQT